MNGHRFRHGLTDDANCTLCLQHNEEIDHLLLGYVYSRKVWFLMLSKLGYQQVASVVEEAAASWWLRERSRVAKERRPAFDSLVLLVARGIWLHRNNVVFRGLPCRRLAWLSSSSSCFLTGVALGG
jgi:hypothetical protein